jgi:3'-phosphoadenosine 5'-phosphosulfate (PAPS) 3'-phosphatase
MSSQDGTRSPLVTYLNKTFPPPAPAPPAYTVIISVFNPEGYDDRQVLHIQQLQINAAYSVMQQHDKAGDAWTQQDPSLYTTAEAPSGLYQMNMISATTPTVDTTLDEEEDDDVEIDAFDQRCINYPLSGYRDSVVLGQGLREIETVLTAYNRTLVEPYGSISCKNALMWVYPERYSCDRPRTVTVEQGPKREKWWDGCLWTKKTSVEL